MRVYVCVSVSECVCVCVHARVHTVPGRAQLAEAAGPSPTCLWDKSDPAV